MAFISEIKYLLDTGDQTKYTSCRSPRVLATEERSKGEKVSVGCEEVENG